jgi:NAD-dependent deacetylase
VLHLHGEIFLMRSVSDPSLFYEIRGDIKLGDKAEDGAQLRPHIVWFEEEVPMMEQAVKQMYQCDYFVVIGTSLQVYPAASLLQYAPAHLPKFIIDKKIPYLQQLPNLTIIEKPATEGILDLKKMLAIELN